MRIIYIKKIEMYDEATKYWAEYDWDPSEKVWTCLGGKSASGFFDAHPDIPRTMTDYQMTLLAIKG